MQTTHSQASEEQEQEQEVSLPIVFAPSEFAPNLIQTTLTAFAPKYAYYLEYFSLFKGDKNYLEYFSLFKGDTEKLSRMFLVLQQEERVLNISYLIKNIIHLCALKQNNLC